MTRGIVHGLEYHGRLCRRDGRPANPGRYELVFSFHADPRIQRSSWSETQQDVEIAPGGFFHVVLGVQVPIDPRQFDDRPRWVATRIIRGGRVEDETGPRAVVLGTQLQLVRFTDKALGRIDTLEGHVETLRAGPSKAELKTQTDALSLALQKLEAGELARVRALVDAFDGRLTPLDRDGGRVDLLEDRLEDLDGPDGDIVDVNDRMDLIQAKYGDGRKGVLLAARLDKLERRFAALEAQVTPDDPDEEPPVTGLPIQGGALEGGLTILKGGLAIESGDLTGKQVKVVTVDAARAVRTKRLVAQEMELRGELTVDNTQRSLQIRRVEGRAASAKRDGPLFLNPRGGDAVVVGNAEQSKGMRVHGAVQAGEFNAAGADLAERFDGDVAPGQVVRVELGRRVVRCDADYDTRAVGIVSHAPGMILGEQGDVIVALRGTVPCRVEADSGPIAVGDLLTTSSVPGHARVVTDRSRALGCVVGKALEPLASGTGVILVLVV